MKIRRRGELLMVGTWANPAEGALAIFRTREGLERDSELAAEVRDTLLRVRWTAVKGVVA